MIDFFAKTPDTGERINVVWSTQAHEALYHV